MKKFFLISYCLSLSVPSRVSSVSLTKTVASGIAALRVNWITPQSVVNISQYQVEYRKSGTIVWDSRLTISGSPPAASTTLDWRLAPSTVLEWEQCLLLELESGAQCRQREHSVVSLKCIVSSYYRCIDGPLTETYCTNLVMEKQYPLLAFIIAIQSQFSDVSAVCGCLHPRSLMKVAIWKSVNLLASVNEPQSCQTYLATRDCSNLYTYIIQCLRLLCCIYSNYSTYLSVHFFAAYVLIAFKLMLLRQPVPDYWHMLYNYSRIRACLWSQYLKLF